jgi:hypothetical protein
MLESEYGTIRAHVRPGDVIAFGGNGLVSRFVRLAGGSSVSHTGIILAAATATEEPVLAESTVDFTTKPPTLNVTRGSLETRYQRYDGMAWWLPLSAQVRRMLDLPQLVRFLESAQGQPFDVPGGLLVVLLDLYQRVRGHEYEEDYRTYFCSELVARALESGGAVGPVDPSLVSPTDLCRWEIYEGTYHYLLKRSEPDPEEIRGYNTRPPGST